MRDVSNRPSSLHRIWSISVPSQSATILISRVAISTWVRRAVVNCIHAQFDLPSSLVNGRRYLSLLRSSESVYCSRLCAIAHVENHEYHKDLLVRFSGFCRSHRRGPRMSQAVCAYPQGQTATMAGFKDIVDEPHPSASCLQLIDDMTGKSCKRLLDNPAAVYGRGSQLPGVLSIKSERLSIVSVVLHGLSNAAEQASEVSEIRSEQRSSHQSGFADVGTPNELLLTSECACRPRLSPCFAVAIAIRLST